MLRSTPGELEKNLSKSSLSSSSTTVRPAAITPALFVLQEAQRERGRVVVSKRVP